MMGKWIVVGLALMLTGPAMAEQAGQGGWKELVHGSYYLLSEQSQDKAINIKQHPGETNISASLIINDDPECLDNNENNTTDISYEGIYVIDGQPVRFEGYCFGKFARKIPMSKDGLDYFASKIETGDVLKIELDPKGIIYFDTSGIDSIKKIIKKYSKAL